MVFYQLCHLSLVISVLSRVIPGLSLAIPGLSQLVQSQFQDVPDSSCLPFNQQYINSYNKLNRDCDFIHILEKISDPRELLVGQSHQRKSKQGKGG